MGVGSLVETVLSLNIKRRHLSIGQLAAMGTLSLPHFQAEARERMIEARKLGGGMAGRGHAKPLASIDAKGLGAESVPRKRSWSHQTSGIN